MKIHLKENKLAMFVKYALEILAADTVKTAIVSTGTTQLVADLTQFRILKELFSESIDASITKLKQEINNKIDRNVKIEEMKTQ